MLEEYVLGDEVSDDVGENLISRDAEFEVADVPFQPKPTSVSVIAADSDWSSESNFTTMPKVERHEEPSVATDLHAAKTMILDNGRGRKKTSPPPIPQRAATAARVKPKTQPPPPPHAKAMSRLHYDEDLHSAPTMIIDIGRLRRNRG
jgi:hypothetical protein